MNRKKQQAEMFVEFGTLFGPLMKWVEHPSDYDTEEKTRIFARFFAEIDRFRQDLRTFSISEPGHNYQVQFNQVSSQLDQVAYGIGALTGQDLGKHLAEIHRSIFSSIFSIPVPVDSVICEAFTPFSTYCIIKDLCSTVARRLIWMDRYFDATIFGLYLTNVAKQAGITLVTYPFTKCKGSKDEQRYKDFMSVSKLFAQERGPAAYRLLTDEQFHDRWLECDDKMLALGNSIKDLSKQTTFTISKLDSTSDNQKQFDEAINRGIEVFGPSQTTHP